MINIETIEVSGFEAAIKGMRNPFKNRDKSDSGWAYSCIKNGDAPVFNYEIGPKDLQLCQKLLASGKDDDSKFMRMIHVQADITAPLYWWKEFDTYKVSTVANSESTMHTIVKKDFGLNDFAHDMLMDSYTVPEEYPTCFIPENLLSDIIDCLNDYRAKYLEAKDADNKPMMYEWWYQIIQLLPTSYMQKRTVDLNYQTLRRIFFARRHHKLKEWSCSGFCDWIMSLPYAEELICFKLGGEPSKIKVVTKEDGTKEYIRMPEEKLIYNLKPYMTAATELSNAMVEKGGTKDEFGILMRYSMALVEANKNSIDPEKLKKEYLIDELERKYVSQT